MIYDPERDLREQELRQRQQRAFATVARSAAVVLATIFLLALTR